MALPLTTYDTATLVNPLSDQTNVQVIIDISRLSAAWKAAGDINDWRYGRVGLDDGTTEYATHGPYFDLATGVGYVLVTIPLLTAIGTHTLRIYPPITANGIYHANHTYGRNNTYPSEYFSASPLVDSYNDFTSKNLAGTIGTKNTPPALGNVAGKIGPATTFYGSAGEKITYSLSTPPPQNDGTNDYTFEAIVSIPTGTTTESYQGIFGMRWNATLEYRIGGPAISATTSETDGAQKKVIAGSVTANSVFTYLVGSYDPTNGQRLYQDGVLLGTDAPNLGTIKAQYVNEIWLGRGLNQQWNGTIEHACTHNVARSPDWVAYQWSMINDQATFWGTWVNVPADSTPPTLLSSSPADNDTAIPLSTNIVFTLDEDISVGTGSITLYKSSDSSIVATVAASSLGISGSVATWSGLTLVAGTSYYILADAGSVTDIAGNSWAGISNSTTLNFSSAPLLLDHSGRTFDRLRDDRKR